jgi:ABC-type transport system involved in cytochrome c biogenesis permease subunit
MLKIATAFYGLSLLAMHFPRRRKGMAWFFLLPALVANAAAATIRYQQAWPMLPMYLGPVALPLMLGGLVLAIGQQKDEKGIVRRTILMLALLTALAAVLFPNDFYLPFLKSQTLAAHLFFIFGLTGKGCLLVSATLAFKDLIAPPSMADQRSAARRCFTWTVWGFALLTFSMFTGELWSYLGWGTPVVWDDPAITAAMATWLFYVCLLRLHLTGTFTIRGRGIYAACGAFLVLALNFVPELGPFRWPF